MHYHNNQYCIGDIVRVQVVRGRYEIGRIIKLDSVNEIPRLGKYNVWCIEFADKTLVSTENWMNKLDLNIELEEF